MSELSLETSIYLLLRNMPQKLSVSTIAAIKKQPRNAVDKVCQSLFKKGLVKRDKFYFGLSSKSVYHYWVGRGRT